MSETAPSDLAVAFRSLPRRLREVSEGLPDAATTAHRAQANRHVADAARLLGVAADTDAVAAAIDSVAADRWDESVLDALRAAALGAGRAVREIEDLRES
jgi:hypothetical protein